MSLHHKMDGYLIKKYFDVLPHKKEDDYTTITLKHLSH